MPIEKQVHDIEKNIQHLRLPEFPRTLGDVYGTIVMSPGLRAFWPLSSMDAGFSPSDVGGQARHLSNNGTVTYGQIGGIPYASLNGSTQWLSRADEAGLDITAGLTFGAWMYCNTNGVLYMPMGKFGASGNFGYGIQRLATNFYRANISGDGTTQTFSEFTSVSPVTTWEFVVARFTPSTELAIFVNDAFKKETVSIPASIFSGNGNFAIGRYDGGPSQYFPGRIALPFLCAATLTDAQILRMYTISRSFFGV